MCPADTTFVDFTRDLAPGIRVLRGGILWLDNVSFKRIAQIPRRRPRASPQVEATAVAAYRESVLIFLVCHLPPSAVLLSVQWLQSLELCLPGLSPSRMICAFKVISWSLIPVYRVTRRKHHRPGIAPNSRP